MLLDMALMLNRNPDRVASAFHAGKEVWDDIIATDFKQIYDEETEKHLNKPETMDPDDHRALDLEIMMGDRIAKVLTERQGEFTNKDGFSLSKETFASLGFLHFYRKYSSDVDRTATNALIRGFRRSDCDFSVQNRAEKYWELVTYRDRYGDQGVINLMFETILMLSKDPYKVAEAYKAGSKIWSDIHSTDYSKIDREEVRKTMGSNAKGYKNRTSERLAETLTAREVEFKKQCGEELYAEVMAVVGVLYFYDAQYRLTGETGFVARQYLNAVSLSNCSETVKEKFEGFYRWARRT